jgi:hypothetical protein
MKISIQCEYLRQLEDWKVDKKDKRATVRVSPGIFWYTPQELEVPAHNRFVKAIVKQAGDLDPVFPQHLRLFGFTTSEVFLVCKRTRLRSWTVVSRVYLQNRDGVRNMETRKLAPSVFEGLKIVTDDSGNYAIELRNVAQFMELLLDKFYGKFWTSEA